MTTTETKLDSRSDLSTLLWSHHVACIDRNRTRDNPYRWMLADDLVTRLADRITDHLIREEADVEDQEHKT